jgi:3-oxoacyl-[acyl-carrier protein] reductase
VGGDLAEEATVLTLFDQAEQRFGGVDIVIANAADALVKPFADYTEADFDGLFAANVKSAFFTLREAARRLGDGGRIVATSSGGTKM